MKRFLLFVAIFCIAYSISIIRLANKYHEENLRLKKERDMFSKLYRKANSNVAHFQDSINKHCFCK